MTIAANIANVGNNWSGGSVGSGALNSGHNDNSPANSLAASTDDAACSGTGQTCSDTVWDAQRRTHVLSNGVVIWDLAGNVNEWTSYANSAGKATPATTAWTEYTGVGDGANTLKRYLVPTNAVKSYWSDSWTSTQGIGQYYGGTNGSGGAFHRGGYWSFGTAAGVFTASPYDAPTATKPDIGFRCATDVP